MKGVRASPNVTNQLRVLVLSPHTGINENLARTLSPDGRYELRSATAPTPLEMTDAGWRPDVVLVDGTLLQSGAGVLGWPVPTLVLAASAADAEAILARQPSLHGWLRRDATYVEFERALSSVDLGVRPYPDRRAHVIAGALISIAIGFLAATCAWLLIA
jgi:hypothetical protein